MAKSHWLINPKRTEVKRFIKNDKSIDGVFDYMFVDTGKIVGVLGKKPPVMTTTVSVDIDLAREIYGRLISQGWRKTEEVWPNKESQVFARNFFAEIYETLGDKVIEAMSGTGVPYKIFKTKLGYSRV